VGCSFSVKTHRKKAASSVCILRALFFCAFLFLTEFRIFVKNRLEQGAKNGIQLQYYVGFFGRREIISRDQPKQGAKKTDFLGYSRDLFRQI
jgi:hypothetical protein